MTPRIAPTIIGLCAVAGSVSFAEAFSSKPKSQVGTHLEAASNPASKRSKSVASLLDWADSNGIKLGGISIADSPADDSAGLGVVSKQDLASSSLVLTVPTDVALSIESPGDGPDDRGVLSVVDRKALEKLPWFAQFAVYLYKLDKISSMKNNKVEMKPWLDSLPRVFDTPIHWSDSQQSELQYKFLEESVGRQKEQWQQFHKDIMSTNPQLRHMEWEDFLWGCECARSRAFSGAYTGGAFNPFSYAFTLLLVLVYVGLDFGTLEQAANGAGLVFCAQILKDFVIPKLFKKKRYIISPLMDMANHRSLGTSAEVSFEFFGDAYSLAVCNGASIPEHKELYISYGARSNDQLLQYYGFVETNNPHDVYIMPPLGDWNIGALEKAVGRTFSPGRLQKLKRAGLLGSNTLKEPDVSDGEEAINSGGGVVVTRAAGVDPAIMQALRALISNDSEWKAAGEAIGNFVEENAAGPENERLTKLAAKTAIKLELAAKPTTIAEDQALLKRMDQMKRMDSSYEDWLGVVFRMEKKKLLAETMRRLQ